MNTKKLFYSCALLKTSLCSSNLLKMIQLKVSLKYITDIKIHLAKLNQKAEASGDCETFLGFRTRVPRCKSCVALVDSGIKVTEREKLLCMKH